MMLFFNISKQYYKEILYFSN